MDRLVLAVVSFCQLLAPKLHHWNYPISRLSDVKAIGAVYKDVQTCKRAPARLNWRSSLGILIEHLHWASRLSIPIEDLYLASPLSLNEDAQGSSRSRSSSVQGNSWSWDFLPFRPRISSRRWSRWSFSNAETACSLRQTVAMRKTLTVLTQNFLRFSKMFLLRALGNHSK